MAHIEPRVSRREKKLHLSYELPDRIHCSTIYPLQAPNGSDILIYGHDRGISVLWRGGKRRRAPDAQRPPPVNDDDGNEQLHPNGAANGYEEREAEEQDPDCPYPPIIQHIDVDQKSQVLQLAVPSISSAAVAQLPTFAQVYMIIALSCADSTITLCLIPLEPPTDAANGGENVRFRAIPLQGDGSIIRSLACKLISQRTRRASGPSGGDDEDSSNSYRLLVAGGGNSVLLWSLGMTMEGLKSSPIRSVLIAQPSLSVAFASPVSSRLLLIYDRSGVVRIFSPSGSTKSRSPSELQEPEGDEIQPTGQWLMSYHTAYHASEQSSGLARRKRILQSTWVLGGRGIMVLLEDGEWGVWDIAGTAQSGKNVEDFVLRGFLGSSAPDNMDSKQKKESTKLAPMTPNTRKTKSENLFSGPSKSMAPGVASSGGISVTSTTNRSGTADESVTIWYNNDIHTIPSMYSFWQRSNTNSTGGFGSLYAPGLTHITDINLMNENITGISQFASNPTATSLGSMNKQRNLLVSAEHRFIVLQHLSPPTAKSGLFQQPAAPPPLQDQRMLDAGELDLGGMDRMLDTMAGNDGRTRKVGFAS